MPKNPLPQRKSPRLQGYDYASDGAYFVTICTYERYLHFGLVDDGVMVLDEIGQIAERHIRAIPSYWEHVDIDHFVVMPNHVHLIIVINQGALSADTQKRVPTQHPIVGTPFLASDDTPPQPSKTRPKRPTLGQIIGNYKSGVTREARRQNITTDKIWQSRYHDAIIRTDEALNILRQYVLSNPAQWSEDELYCETI